VSAFEREELLMIEACGGLPAGLDVTVRAGLWEVAEVQGLGGALELRDVTGRAFLSRDDHAVMLRRFTSDADHGTSQRAAKRTRHEGDMDHLPALGTQSRCRWPRLQICFRVSHASATLDLVQPLFSQPEAERQSI
jgi:hypothetical protein